MQLSFFGGTKTVSGVNYLLEKDEKKILIDCGLFQGSLLKEKNEEPFPYNPEEVNIVILTHAHLDHVGRLPKLVKEGFQGKIFATPPTLDLTKLLLEDELSPKFPEGGLKPSNKNLFSKKDFKKTLNFFEPVGYHQRTEISSCISFNLLDAGHILGSAIVEIFVKEKTPTEEKKIVFSGDLGNPPVPLLKPTEFPDWADYILVESTYGDRTHNDFLERKNLLEDVIEETARQGGTLIIPSFALERTQELLFELNELVKNRRIPEIPIFIDSPLAIKSTKIYKRYEKYYNKEATWILESGDKIFDFPGLVFTRTIKESRKIANVPPPKLIIAGSGLSEGGRILYHEMRYLPDPKSCLLLISYQPEGTRGRELLEGVKEIEIFGKKIPVRARITTIQGYSAHADREKLFRWLYYIKTSAQAKEKRQVKKVFVVQGEEKSAQSLCQLIKDHLGIEAEVPEYGSKVKI